METFFIWFLVLFFCFGYALIALEHVIQLNKAAVALLLGVGCWLIYIGFQGSQVTHYLPEHIESIAEIVFFLMGAMTIVSIMDQYGGLEILMEIIKPKTSTGFLIQISMLSFFLSPILDNMTTAIVACTLSAKAVEEPKLKVYFGGMIILAANAGGAWSPIGDVTTTMLWLKGHLTSWHMIKVLFFPSLISFLIPLTVALFFVKGKKLSYVSTSTNSAKERKSKFTVLLLGLGFLLAVPVLKTTTHIPAALAMLFVTALYWAVMEFLFRPSAHLSKKVSVENALQKIDLPSLLFFIGILLSVAALSSSGILSLLSHFLDRSIGDIRTVMASLGILSALIDNVPLVAAGINMYASHPSDSTTWELLAFCAGTGGSLLIIGSAAGVAVMGMEKISFGSYLRLITPLALVGYLSGIGLFLLTRPWFN